MKTFIKHRSDASFFALSLNEQVQLKKLCGVARRLDNAFCIPATSSNFSLRATPNTALMSRSGLHKRLLTPRDFIRINFEGQALRKQSPKPSDETLLHTVIYKMLPEIGCVLHCHPEAIEELDEPGIKIEGHELLKILGFKDHNSPLFLNTFANDQDMSRLAIRVEKQFHVSSIESSLRHGIFVLAHHGIYCAGKSVDQAEARLEAVIHLLKSMRTGR